MYCSLAVHWIARSTSLPRERLAVTRRITPRSSTGGGTTQPVAGEPQSAPGITLTCSTSPASAGMWLT